RLARMAGRIARPLAMAQRSGPRTSYPAGVDDLQRFLDLVRRELNCDDARFEFGGTGLTEASHVRAEIPGGWRVVALWSQPSREGPASAGERGFSDKSPSREGDRSHAQAKLDALVEA